MTITSQSTNMTSSANFCDVNLFLLSSLVTGPSFMPISSLVLDLWQFTFIRDWLENRKSEIPPSEFCPISGHWDELGIPNLARMTLMKCYYMLQNARVTAFTRLGLKLQVFLKYVWTFCYHQALKKGLNTWLIKLISKDAMSSSKFSQILHICLHYY